MMSGKKNGNAVTPTSTVLQARVMLFQPSQRPTLREGHWIKTSFGRCSVSGRLGQRHADIVEAILFCAEQRRDISDGGIELLLDPARIRKTLSDSRYSYAQIEKLLTDLRMATITIETPGLDFPIIGGLIDHVIPSPATRHDPLTGGDRHLWRIRLGVAMVMLLENDLSLYYQPAPVARLQHGVSQAVARHVLTHQTVPRGGWELDTLLYAVCGQNASRQAIRDGRRRMRQDAGKLADLGIVISDKNRVRRGTDAR